MTDRLRELLDPKWKDTDEAAQYALIDKLIRLNDMDDAAPGWYGETRKLFSKHRLLLVRVTLREAAKVMCDLCKNGKPFDPEYPTYHVHVGTEGLPEWRILCQAQPILALLADTNEVLA